MGVVLAVKKKGEICIAADTMTVAGGNRKQTANYVENSGNCSLAFRRGSSHDRLNSVEDTTKAALNAVAEFDDSTRLPGTFYTIKKLK